MRMKSNVVSALPVRPEIATLSLAPFSSVAMGERPVSAPSASRYHVTK
jgi:hypothetical protein